LSAPADGTHRSRSRSHIGRREVLPTVSVMVVVSPSHTVASGARRSVTPVSGAATSTSSTAARAASPSTAAVSSHGPGSSAGSGTPSASSSAKRLVITVGSAGRGHGAQHGPQH
jgi:hypothetical protein